MFGVLGALTFSLKLAMAFLPNIEPVSLLLIVFAVVFGWKALYITYVYVAMEILFFGLSLWNIYYLYVWAVLVLAAILLRGMKSPLGWAVLSGAFGLMFGALCAVTDLFIGGPGYALAKWVTGITFDLAHCAGNFAIALLMFEPLRLLLGKLYRRIRK